MSGFVETIDDELLSEMEEAVFAAYDASPSGEGVMGALAFAARAAYFVSKGLRAPEAIEKAIGPCGHYGVPRKYKLVPI
jgi:hypothetical protein